MKPHTLIVHHSASPRSTTLEQIRRWHTDKGWNDIGYHWVIEGSSRLRYGRSMWIMGAHDHGENTDTLGVCVVGNNLDPLERWTLSQTLALVQHMQACRRLYGPELRLKMHCEDEPASTPTQCPGLSDLAWMQLLEAVG